MPATVTDPKLTRDLSFKDRRLFFPSVSLYEAQMFHFYISDFVLFYPPGVRVASQTILQETQRKKGREREGGRERLMERQADRKIQRKEGWRNLNTS